MLAATRLKTFSRYFGVVFLVAVALSIWFFGQPVRPSFSAEAKSGIEGIAKSICAAANEQSCQVTWGGKHRWFGSLVSVVPGQAIAGIDHVRRALIAPAWVESSQSNGVTFSDGTYEVFVATESGTITITTLEHTE